MNVHFFITKFVVVKEFKSQIESKRAGGSEGERGQDRVLTMDIFLSVFMFLIKHTRKKKRRIPDRVSAPESLAWMVVGSELQHKDRDTVN